MKLRSLEELAPAGKRVVVRVDWNVTLGKALAVVDDTRIKRTQQTIEWLLENEAKQVVLVSHLGKPGGKIVPLLSLAPVAQYAAKLLARRIEIFSEPEVVPRAQLSILENVRFWEGEESNEPEFAKRLAQMGEAYVNEAFGECHRSSASIVGIPKLLPAFAGFNLVSEVENILGAIANPARPFVVVMGGAKVVDKLKLLETLSTIADAILLGGKLANEFVERNMRLSGSAKVFVPIEGSEIFDIGERTSAIYEAEIAKAKTIVWNGPMGKVESVEYRGGTHRIYEAIILNEDAFAVVGGGDTLSAIREERHLERIDFVSTGGGAMLSLIERGTLTGIEQLRKV